jgi:hypothetical protein
MSRNRQWLGCFRRSSRRISAPFRRDIAPLLRPAFTGFAVNHSHRHFNFQTIPQHYSGAQGNPESSAYVASIGSPNTPARSEYYFYPQRTK